MHKTMVQAAVILGENIYSARVVWAGKKAPCMHDINTVSQYGFHSTVLYVKYTAKSDSYMICA